MKAERDGTITFERCDIPFVKRFGVIEATAMINDFTAIHPTSPFIYDTYQLAAFFFLPRKVVFDVVKHVENSYRTHSIPKSSGGVRRLYTPCARLKAMQRVILKRILEHRSVSPYATAYCKGVSLTANAAPHTGRSYLLKMDISDFFGSIRFDQVYNAVFNTAYFPRQIGAMLTRICCRHDVLPQGAPTSPLLSNLVMKHFDDTMGAWCCARGITYTRYSDDLTFSANVPLYGVYRKAKSMLEDMGFEVNAHKTHFVSAASRQSVTGLTVNEKVAVDILYKRRLRQEVYYALKFGLANAIEQGSRNTFITAGRPDVERYRAHLLGKVQYVLQIEPQHRWFSNAHAQLLAASVDK